MTEISRPNWDDYFLAIATAVSSRGDCTRSQVGAVLVDQNHRLVSTGYNGTIPGRPGCLEGSCPRGQLSFEECPPESPYTNCIAIHAERNALIYANPDEVEGCTLYITRRPCTDCHKLILALGVRRVVWLTPTNEVASEPQYH